MRRVAALFLATTACIAVGAVASGGPAAAAESAAEWRRWQNRSSGLCLQVSGASMADGAAVLQAPCGTSSAGYHQHINVEFVEIGDEGRWYNRLRFRHSGKCVQVVGASKNNGANLVQGTCGSGVVGYHQQLTATDMWVEGDWYRDMFRHSGKCMYVRSSSSGEVVEQTTCGSGVVGYSQQWRALDPL